MPASYIVFGLKTMDIDLVRDSVERLFNVKLVPRHSDEVGEHFASSPSEKPHFDLYHNESDNEDGPFLREPDYPEYPLILDVYNFEHRENIQGTLMGASGIDAVLLEKEE